MQLKHKLALALAAYAVIAFLAWHTLSEPKLRAFVWLVMAFLAFKSLLHWYKETHVEALCGVSQAGARSRSPERAQRAKDL
jgi:hypothetical protein